MPINHPFKVRKDKDTDPIEFRIELPTSIDEVDLIEARFGNVKRMIDRANAQLIVDVAPGIRKRLPKVEVAEAYVGSYCDNGSKDAYVAPKIDADEAKSEAGFSEEQLEWLRQHNMVS